LKQYDSLSEINAPTIKVTKRRVHKDVHLSVAERYKQRTHLVERVIEPIVTNTVLIEFVKSVDKEPLSKLIETLCDV
jgi:hypothetical protein